MFLHIIHRREKHNVSDTGFCFRLRVKPTQLGPIDWDSHYLRRLGSVSVFRWALLSWAQSIEKITISGDWSLFPSSGGTYSVGPNRLRQLLSPETGFCFRLQVGPTQLDPIDRASPYLRRRIKPRIIIVLMYHGHKLLDLIMRLY
jgi:hypothetical protein